MFLIIWCSGYARSSKVRVTLLSSSRRIWSSEMIMLYRSALWMNDTLFTAECRHANIWLIKIGRIFSNVMSPTMVGWRRKFYLWDPPETTFPSFLVAFLQFLQFSPCISIQILVFAFKQSISKGPWGSFQPLHNCQ